ncbi:F-box protein At3g07870-like isoform X1 [Lycium barbarum]|uniref:F-box protein At3g07870-like isoform X1 n=2 Tax=Lycium barbarum TaxID=112863 RepID=UPI00293E91FC|nr:F-box protein At3g07870-like isoform X1 [Lycium barbarum]XP_060185791.1 F-box protein At3g07870-like isoform X1 [Lycium barbarum]
MALECFTWITGLLGSLFLTIRVDDGETFECLPDCLIIDILSRLPAHSFLRCRWVCRRWRALVSSHDYFTTLHDDLSRASRPMVLIQDHFARNGRDLYVFGENKKKKKAAFKKFHLRSELMINKYWEHPLLVYSCQGVLLFASSSWQSTYYVFNPITQEEVTIQHRLHPGFLCALYFCPYTRQFRILYVQVRGSFCQYFVYIFRTQTWRKIRSSSSFNFLPSGVNSAVVNGALHWVMHHDLERKNTPPCENGIMVFRMDKEEFSAMPHPGSTVCNSKQAHRTMTLFLKDDCLSFCNLLFPEYAVDIWILEDYETRVWIKRYKVNLSDRRIFPFSSRFMEIPSLVDNKSGRIKLLNIQEGELLFLVRNEGLFLYNLDHRTMKRIELPRQEMKSYCTCRPYMKSFLAIA